MLIAPVTSRKRPFTVVIIMCFAENSTSEWPGSMFQVVVLVGCVVVAAMVLLLKRVATGFDCKNLTTEI
jgi:hypothetical protein